MGDKITAAAFDLHANITDQILRNADVVCGYQTYPHVDFYQTGYRAGKLCMELLTGKHCHMAAASVPVLIPPSGFTSLNEPFKGVVDKGHAMVEEGLIQDFSVFVVQPWLDVRDVQSRIVTMGEDADSTNGGCVGDSVVVPLRLQERGSKLRTCLFVVDRKAVDYAWSLGVGATAEFSVGAGAANLKRFTWKNIPKGMYPFDLPEDYTLPKAIIW